MSWFKKDEPRSWSGKTAEEIAAENNDYPERPNDAPNDPCRNGHLWGTTSYDTREENGRKVRYRTCDCLRGCGARKTEPA